MKEKDPYYLTSEESQTNCIADILRRDIISRKDGTPWLVTIERESKDKTVRQRAYLHVCIRIIAKSGLGSYRSTSQSGLEEEIKLWHEFQKLPLRSRWVGDKEILWPISSERLTVGQYGDLIDSVTLEMAEMGLTPPPGRMNGYE